MQSFNEASEVLGIIYNYRAYTAEERHITYASRNPALCRGSGGKLPVRREWDVQGRDLRNCIVHTYNN